MRILIISFLLTFVFTSLQAADPAVKGVDAKSGFPVAGADESTPSRAQYFSWINNTNEGSTEKHTLINLAFFRWLRDEFGMQLDIYAWDAGNLDGPGRNGFGTMTSERFRANYPNGWKPIADAAMDIGCRLGLWCGPDGFGETAETTAARIELMTSLCRDYHMALFKFDSVGGGLRVEKQDDFVKMMKACRSFSPDLIVLNHRLNLGKGMPYATTSLWGGKETYIDTSNKIFNTCTAPHHRAGALARGLPPQLTRMVEDHGVCLSSCMDRWDDDLVLQAFNRSLILAPQIYGNPWLLRDDEYPKLARIYNLCRRYGRILTSGMVLPEEIYGPSAVSRGDDATRLVTLRNLTWSPVTYQVRLDDAIGLKAVSKVELRSFHPYERILGRFKRGATVPITVEPFRSCLLLASTAPVDEIGVDGCDAEVVRDVSGKPVLLKLVGLPGTSASVTLQPGRFAVSKATIDGKPMPGFAEGRATKVTFPGKAHTLPSHRKLADLKPCAVPADAQALFESTCFAADNDALEMRSLRRSGPTRIPEVQAARDAFFGQELFSSRGCWDQLLFDGNTNTAFGAAFMFRVLCGDDTDTVRTGRKRIAWEVPMPMAQLRIDFGAPTQIDTVIIRLAGGTTEGQAECSADLGAWFPAKTTVTPQAVTVEPPAGQAIRYLRLMNGTLEPTECEAIRNGASLPRTTWRASNHFLAYSDCAATAAWSATVTIPESVPGSYLCIALDGEHGVDGAWVAARLNGKPLGCPDRAPSFLCNPWETRTVRVESCYTYYLPVTPEMVGQPIDLVALTLANGKNNYIPTVWITNLEPHSKLDVQLEASLRK